MSESQPSLRLQAAWTTGVAFVLLAAAAGTIASASSGAQEPREDVVHVHPAVVPELSAPSGIITYSVTGEGFFAVRASGEPLGRATEADMEHVHDATPADQILSPDGTRSARIERLEDGVWLAVGAPGAEVRQFQIAGPSDPALVSGGKGAARAVEGIPLVVAWSPDSTTLAYGSITGAPWSLSVYDVTQPLANIRSYEVSGGYVGELAWSSDGRHLAISTYSLDRRDHTVLMLDRGSHQVTRLIDGCHLTWSPDGNFLAIHRDPGPGQGAWVISPDGATSYAVTDNRDAFPYVWREG